jgi:16S rRNA (guanine527-N7)-methyltransferase
MRQESSDPALQRRLEQGACRLDIDLSAAQTQKLLAYLTLLVKWNRAFNLTAVKDPLAMVERHLLDSLAVLAYVDGQDVLDLGTGAGLPGIPLALLRPETRFVLLDSNNKKIRFIRQVVLELGIENIQPVCERVEHFVPQRPFDIIIARAFSSLPNMLELTKHLRQPGCRLLAMKGVVPEMEIDQLTDCRTVRIIPLVLPFNKAERHLIEIGC